MNWLLFNIIYGGGSLLGFLACMKMAHWHAREATYWRRVQDLVHLYPKMDEAYGPILDWAKANKPNIRERLGPWQEPLVRMKREEEL